MVAVDLYLTPAMANTAQAQSAAAAHGIQEHPFLGHLLSHDPWVGVTQVALIFIGALVFSYFLATIQTYLIQWAGQKVMFDMRRPIFRHLQHMDVAF